MNIREQLGELLDRKVEFIVVGGQAGVLRQAIEFSHDLHVLVHATPENAARIKGAVQAITGIDPELSDLLGRDFQQYVHPTSGDEIDVHLRLIALPDYKTAMRYASSVDFLGVETPVLELPALYASKRTDRPRDAVHRLAIEARLRRLLLDRTIEPDEVVLACCLDEEVAALDEVKAKLADIAESTSQPLLQLRLIAMNTEVSRVASNPHLSDTARALLTLEPAAKAKLVDHPARLSALLAKVPLLLPEAGHRVRIRPGPSRPTANG
jgi:hypothetical protein